METLGLLLIVGCFVVGLFWFAPATHSNDNSLDNSTDPDG